jgi:hypothetical protein
MGIGWRNKKDARAYNGSGGRGTMVVYRAAPHPVNECEATGR